MSGFHRLKAEKFCLCVLPGAFQYPQETQTRLRFTPVTIPCALEATQKQIFHCQHSALTTFRLIGAKVQQGQLYSVFYSSVELALRYS